MFILRVVKVVVPIVFDRYCPLDRNLDLGAVVIVRFERNCISKGVIVVIVTYIVGTVVPTKH